MPARLREMTNGPVKLRVLVTLSMCMVNQLCGPVVETLNWVSMEH